MVKDKPTFSILITTKNRLSDLRFTLVKIQHLLLQSDVECIIFDDGSSDGTSSFIEEHFPDIILFRNQFSKGLIHCRNQMLNLTTAKYAISLDDDAHFESDNVLENIEKHFVSNPKCGVIACRIFWGLKFPNSTSTNEIIERTKGFVGCGHVWNMEAWQDIPNYPDWFVFYGEEDFAAFQLFKRAWEIQYLPAILVQHRVDIKSRRQQNDYQIRLRRSLRSGWYLYFLFYPINEIPRRFFYTLWMQIKKRVLRGDIKATFAILQALGDIILNFPKLYRQSNRLKVLEFKEISNLAETKIYWHPK
ncbi:glycosyltransferase family 2 protein [Flavobacterium aquicola]|uniref:Glycosyltransferase involved in cell wall biosynthesis n=1 Tax=Flavobacterium aquicola TaxID=1682742 RepID=A0A3E0EJ28_9FLAO|nr:glycosyltransferase family 2 protein [Flavobacterium aquicola]REG98274.1 glycosyltransferase involved in cell wall biosynthesis [Flavobacterium aquicola]